MLTTRNHDKQINLFLKKVCPQIKIINLITKKDKYLTYFTVLIYKVVIAAEQLKILEKNIGIGKLALLKREDWEGKIGSILALEKAEFGIVYTSLRKM